MRITVQLDDKERAWLGKFLALVSERTRDSAAGFALDALSQRLTGGGTLDLKDLTLIMQIAERAGGLEKQARSFVAAVDKASAGWHALPGTMRGEAPPAATE